MKISWLGQSAFRVETNKAIILIDPFINGNPGAKNIDFAEVTKGVTHIALTHGHADHVGDTIAIAKASGATVIANADLAAWLERQGVENVDAGNTGGTVTHDGFSVTFVNALHSSAMLTENGVSQALGNPNGLVFHFEDAPTLYHMGDTDIFSDMALINELHQPEIGLVPIGDRFTMGGAVAALACQRYFKFKAVLPCHYGSFPVLDQTAEKFVAAMADHPQTKVLADPAGTMHAF
ncbi:metal-dependent hydrolase [Brucella sp. BE17]|uniref:metal-dependent hydrolase n=1 Tax=Brucella sp. BE17 TaxID=3142977 RepID=UPI0031B9E1A0